MPLSRASNETLCLQKAVQGDTGAFGQLYDIYAPRIFRYLYTHMNNLQDAEDLTEDVFLRAWRSLPTYTEQGIPFAAFLFRVARNALIDHYRRSGRPGREEILLEDDLFKNDQQVPGETILAGLERQEVREMLMRLREDQRTVLIMRFINNLSPEETAQVMGKTPGAVRVLQHRALNALRKLIEAA